MSNSEIDSLYAALPIPSGSKCIRLLRILASSAHEAISSPIRCELTVADLEQTPTLRYCALSYVWGTKSPVPEYIVCNNVVMRVTTNCYAAIHDLRARLDSMPIWIDAVCLNQRNTKDKEQQIQLMSSIYERATITFIWLDGNRAAVEKVFAYLSRAGFLSCYYRGEYYTDSLKYNVWATWSALIYYLVVKWSFQGRSPCLYKAGITPQSFCNRIRSTQGPSVEELESVLDQIWIRRIWTFQEALLANNPVIICGRQSLEWNRFAMSIVFLNSLEKFPNLQEWLELVHSRAHFQTRGQVRELTLAKLEKYRRFCDSLLLLYEVCWYVVIIASGLCLSLFGLALPLQGRHDIALAYWIACLGPTLLLLIYAPTSHNLTASLGWDTGSFSLRKSSAGIFDHIMETVRTRKSTNPQDISYGLYSAMERFSKHGLSLPRVDYNIPLSRVYAQFTRFLLMNFNTLIPLALAGKSLGPSWVPNYTQNFGYCCLLDIMPERVRNQPLTDNWKFSDDHSGLLVVRGRQIGIVTKIRRFERTQITYQSSDNGIHWLNLSLIVYWHNMREKAAPDTSFRDFMGRIFSTDIALSGASYITPKAIEDYLRCLLPYPTYAKELDELFSAFTGRFPYSGCWWLVLPHYFTRRRYRRLCTVIQTHITITNFLASSGLNLLATEKGVGVAAAIGDVRSGDELFIIEGLVTPLVMRKTGPNYRIVARADMPFTEDGEKMEICIE